MRLIIPHALAALLLAGAAPLVYSQATPPAGLVEEPVASVSRSDEMANAIAQELNADASMKHSKVTVQPNEGGILLTGSTLTDAQTRRALQVATAHAGEGKVSSGILSDEIVLWAPPPQEEDTGLAEPAEAGSAVTEVEAAPTK
jgi:hypothetical protein